MASNSSKYLNGGSDIFKEFDLNQDKILQELNSFSLDSISELDFVNIRTNEDIDFQRIPDSQCNEVFRCLIGFSHHEKSINESELKEMDHLFDDSSLHVPNDMMLDTSSNCSEDSSNEDLSFIDYLLNDHSFIDMPKDPDPNSIPIHHSSFSEMQPINTHSEQKGIQDPLKQFNEEGVKDDLEKVNWSQEKEHHNTDKVEKVSKIGIKKSISKSLKRRKVRNKPNNCYHLYDFIKDVLAGNIDSEHPRCVRWVDKEEKEFEIVNTTDFAKLWGEKKASKSTKLGRKVLPKTMTYEKVSRTLRYYSGEKLRILEKVDGKKCHYRFGSGKIWSKHMV